MTTPAIPDAAIDAFDRAYMDHAESHARGPDDTSERCCIGAGLAAAQPHLAAQTLRAAYWEIREHAISYRATDLFRKRQAEFRTYPDNAAVARGAARDEWYARGLESAARDIAKLLGEPEHEIAEPDPPTAP